MGFYKVEARNRTKGLVRADRASAVMERHHHSSSPICRTLVPSGQSSLSDGCCVIPPIPWFCRLIPLTGLPPPPPQLTFLSLEKLKERMMREKKVCLSHRRTKVSSDSDICRVIHRVDKLVIRLWPWLKYVFSYCMFLVVWART